MNLLYCSLDGEKNSKIITSETLRNKIATFTSNELRINLSPPSAVTENIKTVSIHVPTYLKPCNDTQFGQYLAGLIVGDGHFSSKQQLIIVFHLSDISLAYYIKSYLGYGNIRKIKDKNVVILIIASKHGIETVIKIKNYSA